MLHYFSYNIPFKLPFKASGNEISHRNGVIMVYRDNGIEAYGEVAPLPGFSTETFEQIKQVLLINRKYLQESIQQGIGDQALHLLDHIHKFPSLSFGLDTLLHDLAAKQDDRSMFEYLFPKKEPSLSCNATLPINNRAHTIDAAMKFVTQGFKTLKVKVGEDFSNEKAILTSIRKQFPAIKIRIDANQSWSKIEAIEYLQAFDPLDIEYCEQPVKKDNIEDLKAVKEAVKIPIAADESVRNKEEAAQLSESKAIDLLILKPMLLGTFENIFVTKDVADTHNIKTVFTTSLETAVGRAATAALAAGIGNDELDHGLATGGFLENDLVSETWLDGAKISFPSLKGLGISLHWEGLTEF